MDRMLGFLTVLLGALSSSCVLTSWMVLEMTVRPGENITLHCDCKFSVGVFIVWYRNCSHEKQPPLVLKTKMEQRYYEPDFDYRDFLNPFPFFHLMRNESSQSYDLLITNITDSDEGLYYCGTEQSKVKEEGQIILQNVYRYGNVATRIVFHKDSESSEPNQTETQENCHLCWKLLFSLCPALAVLSSLLFCLLIYYCQKKAMEPLVDEKKYGNVNEARGNQDEDVCYAALEIRQASQRPKKIAQSSDFSTY